MTQDFRPEPAGSGVAAKEHAASEAACAASASPRRDLDGVIAELRRSRDVTHNVRHGGVARQLPSRVALSDIVNRLTSVLFPTHYGQPELEADRIDQFVRQKLEATLPHLEDQTRMSLPLSGSRETGTLVATARIAHDIVEEFASQLPKMRAALVADLRAAHENDSGAASMPEILLGDPGMVAIICYRIARALHLLGAPLIARLITLIANSRTGIDIHPGAEIGQRFSIDHGTGIVIGDTAVIGKNVRLSQNVILCANRVHAGQRLPAQRGAARHPVIEDDVFIFAGATLLGRITIGKGSVIGGNVWLTRSVPPGSNVTQPHLTGLRSNTGKNRKLAEPEGFEPSIRV